MQFKTVLALYLFAVVCHAYNDNLVCPETDNPFNIDFKVDNETLLDGTSMEPDPITITHIDPLDVVCKKNYNPEMAENLRMQCARNLVSLTCSLHTECQDDIISSLENMRNVTRHNWKNYLKIRSIHYFKDHPIDRNIIFGVYRLSDLTGEEIYENFKKFFESDMMYGFTISNGKTAPKLTTEELKSEFDETLSYYKKLDEMGDLSGGKKSTCKRKMERKTFEEARRECGNKLFERLKKNLAKDEDIKLLGSAVDIMVKYLSRNEKSYPGIKLPFWESCLEYDSEENDTSGQDEDEP